ncbi:MAG: transglycosylase domain-containing protein [Flavobacteriaceae bacterium]|jgi:penicillin-binding protein 1A|nr:transglycosylase domain-containing protein [Flavobacteriaceae bacterium]
MEKAIKKNTTAANPVASNKKQFLKKYLYWFWGLSLLGILAVVLLFVLARVGVFGKMPDVHDLENPDIYVASEIISSDGKVLDRFEKEKRIPVEFKDLPQPMIYALMAKEDERFREHSGVDREALFRAVVYGGKRGGGSTLTQQLAKLLFTQRNDDEDGTVAPSSGISKNPILRALQKIKEMIIAVQLEKLYTKDEIMVMYLNKFDFLFNANGIELASQVYFNKHAKKLNLAECAVLVAMLENPALNNPKLNPERVQKRRDVVLRQMEKLKFITAEEYSAIAGTPVKVDFHPTKDLSDTDSYSAYFKYELRKEARAILDDYEKQTGKHFSLYKDGLKIYVTLDSRMQRYAEDAIEKHIKYLQDIFSREQKGRQYAPFYAPRNGKVSLQTIYDKLMTDAMKRTGRYKYLKESGKSDEEILKIFKTPVRLQIFTWKKERDTLMSPWDSIRYHKHIVQAGLMAMEPNTGNIKAWVGGINWKHFQFDHVKQSRRQVGSTFKPFVYATAIKQLNYTPCTEISNEPISLGNWHPRNDNGRYGGSLQLKQALAWSVNMIAVRLIQSTGSDAVIQMARDLGVESPIPRNPTIALGSSDITLYEMVGAYNTFANFGNYVKPEMIWRVEDNNGKVIKENTPQVREVMSEIYAYTMLDLMKGVVDIGTGRGLRGLGVSAEVAGKTGTTNDNADGWFVGITPKLSAGVWVGWEDRYAHFASTGIGQGAKMALPIWAYFMQKVYADPALEISQKDKFPVPDAIKEGWSCEDLASYGGYDGFEGGEGAWNTEPDRTTDANNNSDMRKKDTMDFNR